MINNERRKQKNINLEEEQPGQDDNVGHRFEKIDKLNKGMREGEKKLKENMDKGVISI